MGCGKSQVLAPHRKTKEIVVRHTIIRKPTTTFTKEYQAGNKIGTGGFAEVRRCTHKLTGTMRAVKIYQKNLFPEEYLNSGGLKQEIEIIKRLDHPNLVKIFEYYEDEKHVYITMEFCLGGELFQKISVANRLTENSICDVMRQLFSVVTYIHKQGIAHRDLKPENILIEERGSELTLKIADFGNAASFNEETKFKGETGTSYYMAPEVIEGEYNEKCDEWSCGVILYMLLCGTPPFNGESDEVIMENVKKQKYSLSGEILDKVSEEAKDLVSKILVPEAERITAAEALTHPWFAMNKACRSPRKDTMSVVSNNLRNFRGSIRLKEAMRTFIMSQILTSHEIKPIREVFAVIDSDNDGSINKSDLIEYFSNSGIPKPEEEAEEVFRKIDVEKKGFIEYSQFLKAGIDSKLILSQRNLSMAFNMMDLEKKGFIRAEDLVGALTEEYDEEDLESWRSVIREAAKNEDGLINFQQFINILSS